MNSSNIKTAFTLIELLVVIAIIGILSGLIIVGMSSTTQSANVAKGQVFSASLRDSLLANLSHEWKFDGPTADGNPVTASDILDTWGTDNGTLCTAGGALPNPFPVVRKGTNCISGSCLEFDNVDDQFYVSDPTLRYTGSGRTIDVWIKIHASSDGTNSYIISKAWNGNGYYNYRLYWSSNAVYFYIGGDASQNQIVSAGNILKDRWYNVVVTVNPDSSDKMIKMYINGSLAITPVAHAITTWVPTLGGGDANISLSVGYMYPCDTSVLWSIFDGFMDNIRMFNAAIPASQIKESYYAGVNKLLAAGEITIEDYSQFLNKRSK